MTMMMEPPARPAQNNSGNGNDRNLPALSPPRLPFHPAVEERFGVDKASWKALVEAIFPAAQSVESIILALSYCRARKLDPFKRNVHIVPIWDSKRRCQVDTIWPGIGELRTTAFRTGEYAGRDKAEFGPILTQKVGSIEMKFPEWCQVTVHRFVKGQKVAFSGPQVYWLETYATKKHDDDTPNEMWATRVRGQIEKCAEAAALRAGFPEEIGSDYIADEAYSPGGQTGRRIEVEAAGSALSRTARVLEKITHRPVSEGQTFEPAPEAAEIVATQTAAEGETIDVGTGEVAGAGAAPPDAAPAAQDAPSEPQASRQPPDVSTWPKTLDACREAGMDAGLIESDLNVLVGAWLLKLGKKGKPETTSVQGRAEMVAALRDGRLGADGRIAAAV